MTSTSQRFERCYKAFSCFGGGGLYNVQYASNIRKAHWASTYEVESVIEKGGEPWLAAL